MSFKKTNGRLDGSHYPLDFEAQVRISTMEFMTLPQLQAWESVQSQRDGRDCEGDLTNFKKRKTAGKAKMSNSTRLSSRLASCRQTRRASHHMNLTQLRNVPNLLPP